LWSRQCSSLLIAGSIDNEPCTRHAFARAARTAQLPPADPAEEYQFRSVQLNSVFDIGGVRPHLAHDRRTMLVGQAAPTLNASLERAFNCPGRCRCFRIFDFDPGFRRT
jgi:hypothetical protein